MPRPIMLYQVYDRVGQNVLGPIIPAHHEAKAIRDFTDLLSNPKYGGQINEHPDDFELLHIGIQDEETGIIDPIIGKPQPVITGAQWRAYQEAAQARAEQQLTQQAPR